MTIQPIGKITSAEFAAVFACLREFLKPHAQSLTVKDDSPNCHCLEGGLHPTHKVPMPIAWVKIGKAYVSYHLMPTNCCPKLLDGASKKLKARMQRKSCFNFKAVDETLFQEVDRLTPTVYWPSRSPSFFLAANRSDMKSYDKGYGQRDRLKAAPEQHRQSKAYLVETFIIPSKELVVP